MSDATLDNITAILDEFRNRHHNSAYQTVLFSAKNYDILEKNLEEPFLTKFKKVAYRCKNIPEGVTNE